MLHDADEIIALIHNHPIPPGIRRAHPGRIRQRLPVQVRGVGDVSEDFVAAGFVAEVVRVGFPAPGALRAGVGDGLADQIALGGG